MSFLKPPAKVGGKMENTWVWKVTIYAEEIVWPSLAGLKVMRWKRVKVCRASLATRGPSLIPLCKTENQLANDIWISGQLNQTTWDV
jgi:hypothetical protein